MRSWIAGLSSTISGSVSSAKVRSRASVALDSSRKVGKIANVWASAAFWDAVAENVAAEPVTRLCSWDWLRVSAANTVPVLLSNWRRAPLRSSRTVNRSLPDWTNPGRLPSASLRSGPRPWIDGCSDCCQVRKAWRVAGSSALKI